MLISISDVFQPRSRVAEKPRSSWLDFLMLISRGRITRARPYVPMKNDSSPPLNTACASIIPMFDPLWWNSQPKKTRDIPSTFFSLPMHHEDFSSVPDEIAEGLLLHPLPRASGSSWRSHKQGRQRENRRTGFKGGGIVRRIINMERLLYIYMWINTKKQPWSIVTATPVMVSGIK